MVHNIDPVLFSVGFLQVRYYGLIYVSGFIIAYFFLRSMVKKRYLPSSITLPDIEEFIFYVVIWTVVGSRLFEVLFYNLGYFMQHPLKIFAVWEGGLSFHGGLFGVIVYSVYFTRKRGIASLLWLDLCSIPAAFALFLGRIANFINGELYGLPVEDQVTPPWYSVQFVRTDSHGLFRVPTQLWESLGNLITFAILLSVFLARKDRNQGRFEGLLGGLFLFFYGLFRFVVEFWKDYERNVMLGLSMGQLLCLPIIVAGVVLIWRAHKRVKALPS